MAFYSGKRGRGVAGLLLACCGRLEGGGEPVGTGWDLLLAADIPAEAAPHHWRLKCLLGAGMPCAASRVNDHLGAGAVRGNCR